MDVAPALRLDRRIGPHAYLAPGLGIAGGNLERDLVTVRTLAAMHGTEAGIIDAWLLDSRYRQDWALRKVHELVLSRSREAMLAVWGLAYKPNTHSTKNSPALGVIEALPNVPKVAYDPQARPDQAAYARLRLAASPLDACREADALLVMTPWAEFARITPAAIRSSLRGSTVIDPFGGLDQTACLEAGLSYHRLGARSW
jgi:UDPglucose 6-dehydrogenase